MRLLKLLVALTLCLSLSVTVFAHPGKTDSNGGHTDHSTGEYHYHHGYSAHQHYDCDGDGDLDCPYDFKDMTGINSGESSKTETEYGVFAELDKIRQNQEARKNELDSTEDFEDMVAKYKREQAKSIPLPTPTEQLEKTTSFSGIAKTAMDYAGEGIIFLLEIYIVVGSVWGLIKIIKLIFGK